MQNLDEILKNHKLSNDDYESIKNILGRVPNLLEIGIFSAMWSEHCSYKSSKIYLSGFPTKAEWVIQGPGENAGVIDIGGDYAAIFKMESHNHPSFIEPYAGAATGVGGIMRDIFTMGARPVASLDSIRFGDILSDDEVGKLHKYLLSRVVAGIGDYGNCMGVPTIGGETSFESCYNGNILVNALNLGIAKKDSIFYGRASGVGNSIIYVGSKTGRDGLGGAVMSSDSFSEDSKSLRPTVQVGDPFSEKLLLEACLEVFEKDLIVGIQDMGAAGLTSSSFEMASRASDSATQSGMKLYLDKVPMRESAMTPYELMLSESQERMLLCAKKGKESEIIDIFAKWEVSAAIIGEVTDSGVMELYWDSDLVGNIPIAPISHNAPILKREVHKPEYLEEVQSVAIQKSTQSQNELFRAMLSHPEIADKSYIYTQFDNTILCNTILGSGSGDGSVIRVRENGNFLAMSVYCNPRFCYLNPKEGAKIAVATAGRNCATRGVKPLAITDCLNFGSPENPSVMWQFGEVCEGIKEACEVLKTPVVSGNVSLYNQTNGVDIYPTPSIGMVGLIKGADLAIDSAGNVVDSAVDSAQNGAKNGAQNTHILDSALKNKGNVLVLLGDLSESFGGSLWLKIAHNQIAGIPPQINLYKELALWNLLQNGAKFIKSAKALKEGGIAVAVAKMALWGGYGVEVDLSELGANKDIIFSESQSNAIIEVAQSDMDALDALSKRFNVSYQTIGCVTNKGANLNIEAIAITQNEARELFFNSFGKIFG